MLKNLFVAAVVASLPMAASAATVTGQIDIAGNVNLPTSVFSAAGGADLEPTGIVTNATGGFASFATAFLTAATLTDIDFATDAVVWEAGGFTFTSTSFYNFVDTAVLKGFSALGVITGNGFDATDGMLAFSAQPLNGLTQVSFSSTTTPVPVPAGILLLGTALAGFGLVGRKRA